MGKERIVLGSTKIVTKGEHSIYSKNNISYSSLQKIQQVGRENGIVLGNSIEQLEFSNPLAELIQEAYWIDEKNEKTNLMGIKSNEIRLYIKFNSSAIGKDFSITIKSLDPLDDDEISAKTDFVVEKENSFYSFDLSAKNFQKGGDAIQKLYFLIEIEGQGKTTYPTSEDDYLKVHVVRYIPQVMRAQNTPWEIAAQCQERWFNGDANEEPWKISPILNFVTMDWLLSFSRIQDFYNDNIMKKWNTENAIKSLKAQIKLQTKYLGLKLPDNIGEIRTFGTSEETLKKYPDISQPKMGGSKDIEIMPVFERFYYQNIEYKISIVPPEILDDLFGAFGSFQFRIIAFGSITKIRNNYYKVQINKIGIYLKDSFDFITKGEYLGDWSIVDNDILRNPMFLTPKEYFAITNDSYKAYRIDYNKGMDFNVYSDIKYEKVSYTFYATKNEISK